MPSVSTPHALHTALTPPLIDPSGGHKPRTLILCFDGTSNQYDGDNTNVVKLYSLLRKDDDFDQQLCYYQPGIGTYFNPGVVSPLFQWAAKMLDEAFAWYLDAHVRGGYQFLMQNYVAGDKICIFGFSRGAYTARALAGMLHKIGLLPRDNTEQIPFAFRLYKGTDTDNLALSAGFKQTFCRDVKIEFVGVWETVSSVGVIMGRTLPFTTGNTTIKTFRHALSLDEHRVRFLPNLYHRPTPVEKENQAGKVQSTAKHGSWFPTFLRSKSRRDAAVVSLPKARDHKANVNIESTPAGAESSSSSSQSSGLDTDDKIPGGTDVLEVWFAGCHSDVGGGAVGDDVQESLSDITLRWMVREVVLAQCGITFDNAALVRANIPEAIYKGRDLAAASQYESLPSSVSKSGPVDAELPPPSNAAAPSPAAGGSSENGSSSPEGSVPLDTDVDALQPVHDRLKQSPSWWLLEVIPSSYQYQDAEGNWQRKWWVHLGRGRDIPDGPKFHVTVQQRMKDKDLQYTPRAKWTSGTETYVQ